MASEYWVARRDRVWKISLLVLLLTFALGLAIGLAVGVSLS
jgi:hypothetical protein